MKVTSHPRERSDRHEIVSSAPLLSRLHLFATGRQRAVRRELAFQDSGAHPRGGTVERPIFAVDATCADRLVCRVMDIQRSASKMRNDTFTADGEILAYSHYVPAASPNGRLLSLMAPVPPTVSALDISPSILFRVALAPFVSISRGMARVRRNFNNPVWSGARSRLKLQLSSCLSFRLS